MAKGIFIGNIAFQIEKPLSGKRIKTIGGSLFYSVPAAKLISDNFIPVSAVGNDFDLTKVSVFFPTTKHIHFVKNGKTARFINIEKKHKRTFSEQPGITQRIYPHLFPQIRATELSFVHMATMHPQNQLDWLKFLKNTFRRKVQISADLFELYTKTEPHLSHEVVNNIDLLFLNLKEFYTLKKKLNLNIKIPYILKMGPNGASYIYKNKIIHAGAPKVKAVNTSGAGETLAAVFLMLTAHKIPIKKVLETAVFVASQSVTKVGTLHLLENNYLKQKLRNVLK